jgi:tRNA (guanine37-N1)-methyltransferase
MRRTLIAKRLLDFAHKPEADNKFVYFPVTKSIAGAKTVNRRMQPAARQPSFEEELARMLSPREREALVRSFDVIGDIAVLEIPRALAKKEKRIADALLRTHKNVKVVAKKTGAFGGVFRVRPVKVIAGEWRTETVHRESGCAFALDIAKVYFSPRLSYERERIAGQVKPGERVLALFAGVGPFPIIIAKRQPTAEIIAIELNPVAVKYLKRNIKLNRVAVRAVLGDVKKLLPEKFRDAQRILMPLPKGAEGFLRYAFAAARNGCIIHFYAFCSAKAPFEEAIERIEKAAKKSRVRIAVLSRRVVRPYSPSTVQVVVDFKVLKESGGFKAKR